MTPTRLYIAWLFIICAFFPLTAQGQSAPPPDPPPVPARGYLLEDAASGRVLAAKAESDRLEPASITKLMTAYVIFKNLEEGRISIDDEVLISEKAWRMPGSRTFIEVGTRVRVEDLLRGMIVQSGNDATVALAEHVAGAEETFVTLMNQEAQALGLAGTHYANSTGMPHEAHYTTAKDILALARSLILTYPDRYKMFAEKSFTYNDITQENRNRLLWWDDAVDGLKTGHTSAAGYCLASSAKKENTRLLAVILGAESAKAREQASQELLTYGFRFFETAIPHRGGSQVTSAKVWKGASEVISLGLAEDLALTIPRGQGGDLKVDMEINPKIIAPITKGAVCGKLKVSLGGEVIAERPLIALEATPEGSLWQQFRDEALLYFE